MLIEGKTYMVTWAFGPTVCYTGTFLWKVTETGWWKFKDAKQDAILINPAHVANVRPV